MQKSKSTHESQDLICLSVGDAIRVRRRNKSWGQRARHHRRLVICRVPPQNVQSKLVVLEDHQRKFDQDTFHDYSQEVPGVGILRSRDIDKDTARSGHTTVDARPAHGAVDIRRGNLHSVHNDGFDENPGHVSHILVGHGFHPVAHRLVRGEDTNNVRGLDNKPAAQVQDKVPVVVLGSDHGVGGEHLPFTVVLTRVGEAVRVKVERVKTADSADGADVDPDLAVLVAKVVDVERGVGAVGFDAGGRVVLGNGDVADVAGEGDGAASSQGEVVGESERRKREGSGQKTIRVGRPPLHLATSAPNSNSPAVHRKVDKYILLIVPNSLEAEPGDVEVLDTRVLQNLDVRLELDDGRQGNRDGVRVPRRTALAVRVDILPFEPCKPASRRVSHSSSCLAPDPRPTHKRCYSAPRTLSG